MADSINNLIRSKFLRYLDFDSAVQNYSDLLNQSGGTDYATGICNNLRSAIQKSFALNPNIKINPPVANGNSLSTFINLVGFFRSLKSTDTPLCKKIMEYYF